MRTVVFGLIIAGIVCSSAHAKYGGGSGTAGDPYRIYNAGQMNAIGADSNDWDKHFRLMADIDLGGYTGTSFNIIGSHPPPFPFKGVFDGNGHSISNFTYESNDISHIGLFGYVCGDSAVIKDLGLIDTDIDAGTGNCVGSLVGWLHLGALTECYAEGGSVSGNSCVGGIVGTDLTKWHPPPPRPPPLPPRPQITNCYTIVDVTGEGDFVGGLIGSTYRGKLSACYAAGKTVSGGNYVGGLVGDNSEGIVINCYSAGSVIGANDVGGLLGWNRDYGTITNCYSAGGVSGANDVGGLVGYNSGIVTASFWDIQTSGQTTSDGGTPKTTDQMQTESTFIDAGWDFIGETANGKEDIWRICEWHDYPRLSWEAWKPCSRYGGGSGTAQTPYRIYNASQMNTIGANPGDWYKHFRLMADIDLSAFTGTEFNVIGRGRPEFAGHEPFTGTFDGNHHVISNFAYETTLRSSSIGIFGSVYGENSEIKNLTLRGPHVHVGVGSFNTGCLAGSFRGGSVYNCRVEGAIVSGANYVGGMFGNFRGTITDCNAEGNISGSGVYVGGLVGCNGGGIMSSCYSSGSVFGVDLSIGGLVGINTAMISNCNSSASVSGSKNHIGGLAGTNAVGIITKCYATGVVSGYGGIGGLVGNNMDGGTISECYATANASGSNGVVGGLVGIMQWDGTIINCYSTGRISGMAYKNGGLIGRILIGTVANCYSTSRVEGSSSLIGGLVGENETGQITNSFWDIEMSGQASSDGGIGKTTNQMQIESTFTDAGWDFTTPIWKMCGGPYHPRLWWEKCPERPVYYVDADANGANNGVNWTNAYNYLQDALAAAQSGSIIHMAQGTYKPGPLSPPPPPGSEGHEPGVTVTVGYRTDTFELKNGVAVKGGYAGFGEPDPNARNIKLYETILSGDLNGDDGPGFANNSENCYHVVTGSGTYQNTLLDGLTITAGNANGSNSNHFGGGMYNYSGSPTISNCTFTGNSGLWGAGIYNHEHSNPILIKCIFNRNSAKRGGGGIFSLNGDPTITNCKISNNTASGIHLFCSGYPTILNCTITGNSGGGISRTGGMPACGFSTPTITNSIVWDNRPQQFLGFDGSAIVTYSNIYGGWSGEGNIDTDPCFAKPGYWNPNGTPVDANDDFWIDGDCHLKSQAGRWEPNSQTWVRDAVTSPCIDVGDSDSDWRGELWPHGKRINMGVYGGSPQASMSLSKAGNIADLNFDRRIDYRDVKLLTDMWLNEAFLHHEDLNRDGFINFIDFAVLANISCIPEPAGNPNPPDGIIIGNLDFDLSWTAGSCSISHDVYFGTSNPPPFILNQKAASFDPGTMTAGKLYYWRIDEVNNSGTTTGSIWSFLTMLPPPPPPF